MLNHNLYSLLNPINSESNTEEHLQERSFEER